MDDRERFREEWRVGNERTEREVDAWREGKSEEKKRRRGIQWVEVEEKETDDVSWESGVVDCWKEYFEGHGKKEL